ncbi:MAG: motility associated factor glycosyltransferase family protein [Aminivibrio sp.]|jgi:hypothetical protein
MKDTPALLEQNLRHLEKFQPKLAARLREELASIDELPPVEIQETAAGRWVQVGEGEPFFDKGPAMPRKRKASDAYCFIIQGVGYPPYLFHVLHDLPKNSLSIIIIEPDVRLLLIVFSMTSVFLAAPQAARISFISYHDKDLIDEAIWHNVTPIGIFPVLEAETIRHGGIMDKNRKFQNELHKEFWEQIRFRAEQLGNSSEDTLLGVRHGAINTPWIIKGPGFSAIRSLIGGRPAVCVASGPSLKKNIDQLRGMEDKCLIIACDTSLLPLLRRGIRPHVVVTIERNLMYDVWVPGILKDHFEECRHILLVCQSVSEPQTAGRWPGPVSVVGKMDSPADAWLVYEVLGRNLLTSGMSVAHMAMGFALVMQSPAIALVGQDLAFADDGETTHIEDASSATPDGIARERTYIRREVPGALGGIVQTHQMWFYFLQIFERFLDDVEAGRVFQCSEGGAAIRGTEAIPLARFFEEHVTEGTCAAPIPDISDLLVEVKDEEYLKILQANIKHASGALSSCNRLLNQMEKEVDLATAPALVPERRRTHAVKVAGMLDQLHASHRALAFIGQSYTHLAGSSMARNRFLDTVEQVDDWKRVHSEIIKSHRVNVGFLREWLSYMEALCNSWQAIDQYAHLRDDGVLVEIERLLGSVLSLSYFEPLSPDVVLLTYLLCKVDLVYLDKVSPAILWNAALFFQLQGRSFEGCALMKRAYSMLEESELNSGVIVQFLLDWARMEASHDLIRIPRFDFALTLLENISSYSSDFSELVQIEREKILEMQDDLITNARKTMQFSDEMKVLDIKHHAQKALYRHDLPEAFSSVMMMDEYLTSCPELVVPQMQWLAKTALDCMDAEDSNVRAACETALAFLLDKQEALSRLGFPWPPKWAEYLREKGFTVTLA